MTGIRRSISTTSGLQPRRQHDRLGAVGGLADHLEVLVLDEHRDQADPHHGWSSTTSSRNVIAAPPPSSRHLDLAATRPGALSTSNRPPTSAARAVAPSSP